jgi:hypothetical protein
MIVVINRDNYILKHLSTNDVSNPLFVYIDTYNGGKKEEIAYFDKSNKYFAYYRA